MKISATINESNLEGSECQVVQSISYTGTRTFDINLKAKFVIRIDYLNSDKKFNGRLNIIICND